jgi:hypothetical protein
MFADDHLSFSLVDSGASWRRFVIGRLGANAGVCPAPGVGSFLLLRRKTDEWSGKIAPFPTRLQRMGQRN